MLCPAIQQVGSLLHSCHDGLAVVLEFFTNNCSIIAKLSRQRPAVFLRSHTHRTRIQAV